MSFGTNKALFEVIKDGVFRGMCFRHIYSGVHSEWYRKSQKEFDVLGDIDQKYAQIIMILVLISMVLNAEHH